MSTPTRSPLRIAGAVVSSGSVNTGEERFTLGGENVASIYSGIIAGVGLTCAPGAIASGMDVLFFSGAGRLKDVVVHTALISGQAITFYDAGAIASGGPIFASGHLRLATIPASPPAGISGSFIAPGSYPFDVPFKSGLCCHLESGSPAFSVIWTPEVNPTIP